MKKIGDPRAAKNTGSYSPALRFGDFVMVSGQGPIDVDGNIVPGNIEEQCELTMQNVATLIKAAGASMDQVVKCTCYLADINDFAKFDAVYRTFFDTHLPCRTTIAASLAGIDIEIDAMAYVGKT